MDPLFPRHPPRVDLPPAFSWALEAAFATASDPLPPPPVPRHHLEDLLQETGLWPAIASRLAHPAIRRHLDPSLDALAIRQRAIVAEGTLRAFVTIRQVRQVADRHGIPLVFLKGAALHLAEWVSPCGRPLADVDVLAPASLAPRLHSLLAAEGYRRLGPSLSRHHLDPLGHPVGLPVEIHLLLPGCSPPEAPGRPLRFEDLDRLERAAPASRHDPWTRIPAPDVLAAHLVVHGMLDHGLRPDRYPPWRWLLDLAALPPEAASDRWIRWTVLPQGSGLAIDALLHHLRRPSGEALPGDPEARRLFLHLAAATLDPDYRLALKARQWWPWPLRTGLREGLSKALHRLRHPSHGEMRPSVLARELPAAIRALFRFYLDPG